MSEITNREEFEPYNVRNSQPELDAFGNELLQGKSISIVPLPEVAETLKKANKGFKHLAADLLDSKILDMGDMLEPNLTPQTAAFYTLLSSFPTSVTYKKEPISVAQEAYIAALRVAKQIPDEYKSFVTSNTFIAQLTRERASQMISWMQSLPTIEAIKKPSPQPKWGQMKHWEEGYIVLRSLTGELVAHRISSANVQLTTTGVDVSLSAQVAITNIEDSAMISLLEWLG